MIQKFEPISISNESTVVADLGEFIRKETAYQSESDLENQFIELLKKDELKATEYSITHFKKFVDCDPTNEMQ